MEQLAEQSRARPESDVLSRGAGMRYFSRPKDATPGAGLVGGAGQETPATDISPDMGTFGMQPSNENLAAYAQVCQPILIIAEGVQAQARTGMVSRKPVPPVGTSPPAGPLPSTPQSVAIHSQQDTPSPMNLQDTAQSHHVHHAHPEFPFNPMVAAFKQEEAMRQARAEALATLERARAHDATAPVPGQDRSKGPRVTMESSEPSFGHIFHKDGGPMSRHMSLQPEAPLPIPGPPPQVPDPTERSGPFGSGPFFRIPFGVPLGASIPRPMLITRNSSGMGVGMGLSSRLADFINPPLSRVTESPEGRQRRDDRSAYVETVHDVSTATLYLAHAYRSKNRSIRLLLRGRPDQPRHRGNPLRWQNQAFSRVLESLNW